MNNEERVIANTEELKLLEKLLSRWQTNSMAES